MAGPQIPNNGRRKEQLLSVRRQLTDIPNFEERVEAIFGVPPGDARLSRLSLLFSLRDLRLIERSLKKQRKLTRREVELLGLIDREDIPGLIRMAQLRGSVAKYLQAVGDPYSSQVFRRVTGRDLP